MNIFRRKDKTVVDIRLEIIDDRAQFASDLQLMKLRASRLGLFVTMQRLDSPIRMVGFEMQGAGGIEACLKYEEALERKERTKV